MKLPETDEETARAAREMEIHVDIMNRNDLRACELLMLLRFKLSRSGR